MRIKIAALGETSSDTGDGASYAQSLFEGFSQRDRRAGVRLGILSSSRPRVSHGERKRRIDSVAQARAWISVAFQTKRSKGFSIPHPNAEYGLTKFLSTKCGFTIFSQKSNLVLT